MESSRTGRSKTNSPRNESFKGKFCLCFKPVTDNDADDDDNGGGDAYEPAVSLSTIWSSALMADCRERNDGWTPRRRSSKKNTGGGGGGEDNDSHNSNFWHILKKAFNDNILWKKIKRRKAANKRKFSRSSTIIKIENNSKQKCKNSLELSDSSLFTRSSLSSLTNSSMSSNTLGSSSSSSSPTPLSLISTPKLLKGKKKRTTKFDHRTKVLCYILVSGLLILVLWGKFFAIICVSSWFYIFLPRQSGQAELPGLAKKKEEEEFDTAEYKKKVIMEGLLERNKSPLMSMGSITRPCV